MWWDESLDGILKTGQLHSAYLLLIGCAESLSLPQEGFRRRVQGNFGDFVRSLGEL